MKKTYFATVHEDKKGPWRYICAFPDFDNLATEENTLEGITKMATEILTDALNDMEKEGVEPPVPTEDYQSLIAKAGADFGPVAFIMPITVTVESPIIRISMTIPQNKLDIITKYAKQRDTTRSALMIDATMDYMKRNG
jgi:predicted RNase H-like HicB family nuclease